MLVGPAGGGKTTTRQILKRALVVLPTIQAREQQQPLGTGDYPEETGSTKTSVSFMVWSFPTLLFFLFICKNRYIKSLFWSVKLFSTDLLVVDTVQIL